MAQNPRLRSINLLPIGLTAVFAILSVASRFQAGVQTGEVPGYVAFRSAFKRAAFRPIFITSETTSNGPALEGPALEFLNSRVGSPPPPFLIGPFEPVAAFPFANQLHGYLIRGSSELNESNISLVVIRNDGVLKDVQLAAGRKGDEGYYDEHFGWIRDLNGDAVPDLLIREQFAKLSSDASYEEYEERPLRQKTWNGNRFVNSNFPITAPIRKLTDENLGTFRLEQFRRWDSDPRGHSAAIHSYEIWIRMYPGHSQMTAARSRLDQLRRTGK
jgi:hypothetical protein